MPCRTCTNCNRFGHFAKDCKVGPRMVDPLNARNLIAARGACFECGGTGPYKAACPMLNRAPGQRGNRPNQVLVVDGGQGRGTRHQGTWKSIHAWSRGGSPGPKHYDGHKAEIICHEKVVRIPLPNEAMLRVLAERPEEKVRHLMSSKAEEHKLKDIIVVRNLSEVIPDDLSGLPPSREIKFRIDLIPGAMPGRFKSSLCLAPSEMEELSSQI
ncbi:putative reverse transcriptase domain-containing protein [Tanacetum coccineum]